jgi:hypothetical protein
MPRRSTLPRPEQRLWSRLFAQPVGKKIFSLVEDYPRDKAPPRARVARLVWLFENAECFVGYEPAQVGQAVWWLASEIDGELEVLRDESVDAAHREHATRLIARLFEALLVRVCRRELSHGRKADDGPAGWANDACYMFWDICPIGPRGDEPRFAGLDEACLDAMARTLAIPHIACQEAALHGLGHWHHHHPARVEAVVDAFLARARRLPKELTAYARRARNGHVQ